MYISLSKLLNYLITLLPFSLIIGNTISNSLVILICVLGFVNYRMTIFELKGHSLTFITYIYLFFLYLIFITIFNNYNNLDSSNILYKENIFKSLFYLRFLILFLIVNKLCKTKSFNFKNFFIIYSFLSLIIALDLIYQSIVGQNIIGILISNGRPSSFFGDENIAGSWLQKYSLFIIPLLIIYNKIKKKEIFFLLFFILFASAIFLSINRMAFIIYVFSIIIFYIFRKKIKLLFVFAIFIFFSFSFSLKIIPENSYLRSSISSFYYYSKRILFVAPNLFYNNKIGEETYVDYGGEGYLITFNSGVQLWKKNKIFGSGLKSFRINCKFENNQTCNTHPHNYTIEIMLETGLIGLFLIYSIFFISLKNYLKYYFQFRHKNITLYNFPLFLILFFETFPIRSTGSFFTTSNSITIFLILSLLYNFKNLQKN